MENRKKLQKPGYGKAIFIIGIQVAIFLAAVLIWGEDAVFIALGLLIIISAVFSLKTRNSGYILLTISLIIFTIARLGLQSGIREVKILSGIAHASGLGLVFFIIISKRGKWRFREIFELAARPVQGKNDGFTSRPFPAATIECSQDEFKKFAEFLLKHLIAVPYFEHDRTVLVLSGYMYWRALGVTLTYDNETWVALSDKGEISVSIKEKSYRWYKNRLSFDELCMGMADLFIGFFELYRSGDSEEIIRQLNSCRENVLAEV